MAHKPHRLGDGEMDELLAERENDDRDCLEVLQASVVESARIIRYIQTKLLRVIHLCYNYDLCSQPGDPPHFVNREMGLLGNGAHPLSNGANRLVVFQFAGIWDLQADVARMGNRTLSEGEVLQEVISISKRLDAILSGRDLRPDIRHDLESVACETELADTQTKLRLIVAALRLRCTQAVQ